MNQRAREVALLSQMSATIMAGLLDKRDLGRTELGFQRIREQAIDQAFKIIQEVSDLHEKNHPEQGWLMGL